MCWELFQADPRPVQTLPPPHNILPQRSRWEMRLKGEPPVMGLEKGRLGSEPRSGRRRHLYSVPHGRTHKPESRSRGRH